MARSITRTPLQKVVPMLRKKWFRIILILVVLVSLAQLYRPEIPMPPVTGDFDGPPEVKHIFKTSCYDCHSNETELAWFDNINPIYLMARSHVMEGRSFLNFSHWDSLNTNQKKAKLFDVLNVIKNFNRMPKPEYVLMHPNARLDSAEISIVERYIMSLVTPVKYDSAQNLMTERKKGESIKQKMIKDAPNGIPFMPEYRNWKTVSTTERFDNNSFRVILANPIAEKAIQEGKNNPYPDGSILAKLVWHQKALTNGTIIPGDFIHIEFMIKDEKRFSQTMGWGWARWKGEALTPYGASAMFVNECINCHKPVKNSDFVFTRPIVK